MLKNVNNNLQLKIYAFAFEKVYGYLPNQVVLQKIGSKQAAVYIPKFSDLVETKDFLVSAGRKILNNEFSATPTKIGCTQCPYRSICKFSL